MQKELQLNDIRRNIRASVIIATLLGKIKNKRDFDVSINFLKTYNSNVSCNSLKIFDLNNLRV